MLKQENGDFLLQETGNRLLTEDEAALTGQALTMSAGGLIGRKYEAIVSAVGTCVIGLAVALTGLELSVSAGTVEAATEGGSDIEEALTGNTATVADGSTIPAHSLPLTGQVITTEHGIFTLACSASAAGLEATSSAGAVAPSGSVPLAGEGVTAQSGTLGTDITTDLTFALDGIGMAAFLGTLTASGEEQVSLLDLQRWRHFGRSTHSLVAQRWPRRIR